MCATPPPGEDPVSLDFEALARDLGVLASPNRLRLLAQLTRPRAASDVRLMPEAVHAGENPQRAMTRQAVHHHLEKLHEIGVVTSRSTRRGGVPCDEYVVNHRQVFAIAEEFRRLGALRPTASVAWNARTFPLSRPSSAPEASGPHLVLVHGLDEGTVFPLSLGEGGASRSWLVGRRADAHVCLDYDPFVSAENARVVHEPGSGFRVEDVPGSRNGVAVNWRPVPPGGSVSVEHGDVVGVGKTLLLFRTR